MRSKKTHKRKSSKFQNKKIRKTKKNSKKYRSNKTRKGGKRKTMKTGRSCPPSVLYHLFPEFKRKKKDVIDDYIIDLFFKN